jgi:hypothetical protein
MASKTYNPTTWVNGRQPAISAENLNKIEQGISGIDDRVIELDGDIADISAATQTATDAQISAIVAKIRGI